MERAHQVVGDDGLQIPLPLMQQYGLQPGAHVTLEFDSDMIRIVPQVLSRAEIEKRALRIALRYIGDAAILSVPPFPTEAGIWRVAVRRAGVEEPLGYLNFRLNGELTGNLSEILAEIRESAQQLAAVR